MIGPALIPMWSPHLDLHSKPEVNNDISIDLAPNIQHWEDESRAEDVEGEEDANY